MAKPLIVNVGSNNPSKQRAVRIGFRKYYGKLQIKGFDVDSGVSAQPKSLKEIVKGAENRAKAAYRRQKCDYSIGLEAGIFKFPGRSGYMDVCISAIYDGRQFFYGGSPIFEYPNIIMTKIFKEKKEIGDILDELLNRSNVKHAEGAIGWLSKGRINRDEYVSMSVLMALVALMNKEMY